MNFNNSKRIYFIIIFFIFPIYLCHARDSNDIENIRNQFKVWQPILNNNGNIARQYFHVYSGVRFEKEEWLCMPPKSDNQFVGEKVTCFTKDTLGTVLLIQESTPSGDWSISSQYYYWPTGELYFIFWTMNTTQADEPMTIERRLYFNKAGEEVRFLESVYKMNTKDIIEKPNYLDQEVKYWLRLSEVPFKK